MTETASNEKVNGYDAWGRLIKPNKIMSKEDFENECNFEEAILDFKVSEEGNKILQKYYNTKDDNEANIIYKEYKKKQKEYLRSRGYEIG